MPAVTWTPAQPEISSRTSLRSVAEYLSEVQESPPMPKRRLCLSPETLKVLENAEKLVEDAEKQISLMNFNTFAIDDLEDRYDDIKNEDEKLYIRNVVASMFKKGFYDPGPSALLHKDNFKSKFSLAESSRYKPQSEFFKSTFSQRESQRSTHKINEQTVTLDECLVCKFNKVETTEQAPNRDNKIVEQLNANVNIEEKKLDEDRPEKLNVQKGPSISIKGDLSIQTMKVIDIQPKESHNQMTADRFNNVATYEFHHASYATENASFDREIDKSLKSSSEKRYKNVACETSIISCKTPDDKNVKHDQLKSQRNECKCNNESSLGKQNFFTMRREHPIDDDYSTMKINEEKFKGRDVDIWKAYDDFDIDIEDFNLSEPRILIEVDSLLDQQRKIIRQVHNATEKFDKFLAKRLPKDISLTSDGSDNVVKDQVAKEYQVKRNNIFDEKKCQKLTNGLGAVEFSNAIAKDKESNAFHNSSLSSVSRESDRSKKIASKIMKTSEAFKNIRSIEIASMGSKVSFINDNINDNVNTERDSLLRKTELSDADTLKDLENTESLKSVSSINEKTRESDKNSQKSKLEDQQEVEKRLTSNNNSFTQTSIHTETKSNAGYIENLKNVQILKENNFDANSYRKEENNSIVENLKSIVDKEIGKDKIVSEKSLNEKTEQNLIEINALNIKESEQKNEIVDERVLKSNESKKNISEEKNKDYSMNNRVENNKDTSAKNLPDTDNSGKTLHLIESISEISFPKISENSKYLHDSLRLSSLSNIDKKSNSIINNAKDASSNEPSSEESTESKIESKLSEARDNLNTLMKTMSENNNYNYFNPDRNSQTTENLKKCYEKNSASYVETTNLKNQSHHKDVANNVDHKAEDITVNGFIDIQECNTPNARTFVTMLEENSNEVHESFQQRRLNLLKKLESCSIPSHYRGKRLFTSTILGDTEPPNSFARLKEASESSSETHSEGEVYLSSLASCSIGEIREKIKTRNKSSSSAKSSSSQSGNVSLTQSAGEIGEIEIK